MKVFSKFNLKKNHSKEYSKFEVEFETSSFQKHVNSCCNAAFMLKEFGKHKEYYDKEVFYTEGKGTIEERMNAILKLISKRNQNSILADEIHSITYKGNISIDYFKEFGE